MSHGLYCMAIATFGESSRFEKAQEEATELALAIIHYQQGKISLAELADEIEGCRMTLDMLEMVIGSTACVAGRLRQKQRLRNAIDAELSKQ